MNKMMEEFNKSVSEAIKPLVDIATRVINDFKGIDVYMDTDRDIKIGDRVINQDNGTIGKVVGFYKQTSFIEDAVVITDDGRNCIAPTTSWAKTILNKKFGIGVK